MPVDTQNEVDSETESEKEAKYSAIVRRKPENDLDVPVVPKIELPLSVITIISKIEQAQLRRVREHMTMHLAEIMNNVHQIITRYPVDLNVASGRTIANIEYNKKKRTGISEKMITFAQNADIKEKTFAYILSWLEEWSALLSDMTVIDIDEHHHWIAQMEMLPDTLKTIENNVKTLSRFSASFFEDKRKQKKKTLSRGILWKTWKERVIKRPATAHPLRPDQMINDQFATNIKVSEIQDMLQELIGTSIFNKLENNAIKYISTTIINLSKALSLLSDELKVVNFQGSNIYVDETSDKRTDLSMKMIQDLSEENEMLQQKLQDAEEKYEQLQTKVVTERQIYTALPTSSTSKMFPGPSSQSSIAVTKAGDIDDNMENIFTKEFGDIVEEAPSKVIKGSRKKWGSTLSYTAQPEIIPDLTEKQPPLPEKKQKKPPEGDIYEKDETDEYQSQKRKYTKGLHASETSGSNLSDNKSEQKVSEAKLNQPELQTLGKKNERKRNERKLFSEAKSKSPTESQSQHFLFTETKSQSGKDGTSSLWEQLKKGKHKYSSVKSPISSEIKVKPTTESMEKESKSEMSSLAEILRKSQSNYTSEPKKEKKLKKHQISSETTTSKEEKTKKKEILAFTKKAKTPQLVKSYSRIPKRTSESTRSLESEDDKSEQTNLEEFQEAIMDFLKEKIDNIGKPFDKKTVLKEEELLKRAEVEKLGSIKAKMEEYFQKVAETVTKILRRYKDIEKEGQVEEKLMKQKKIVSFMPGLHLQKSPINAKSESSTFPLYESTDPVINNLLQMILAETESERDVPTVSVGGKDHKKEKQRQKEYLQEGQEKMSGISLKHQLLEKRKLSKDSDEKINNNLEEKKAWLQMEGTQGQQKQKEGQDEVSKKQQKQRVQKQIEQDEKQKQRGKEEEEHQKPAQQQMEALKQKTKEQEILFEKENEDTGQVQKDAGDLELKMRVKKEKKQKPGREVEDQERQRQNEAKDQMKIEEEKPEEIVKMVTQAPVTSSFKQRLLEDVANLNEEREFHRNLKTSEIFPDQKKSIPIIPTTSTQSSPSEVLPISGEPMTKHITLTSQQAQDPGITLTPQKSQAQGITLTPQKAEDQGTTLTPQKAEDQGTTLTPQKAEDQGTTLTPQKSQAQGITVTPQKSQAQGITVTPQQAQAQETTLTPQKAQAQGITLTPQKSQAQGITVTPQKAQAQETTLTPQKAQAQGITLTPQQAQAQETTLTHQKAQAQRITLTPQKAQPQGITLTPQKSQAQETILTPQKAQAQETTLTPQKAQAQETTLTPQKAQAQETTLTPQKAKAQGITLTPQKAKAQDIPLTPQKSQAQGIPLTPQKPGDPSQPPAGPGSGITVTPPQAQAQRITLTPQQAQAQGITLTLQQAQDLGILLTPQQAQAQGITVTPPQAQAQGITLSPQVQDLGITLTPQQAQAQGITLTLQQAQDLGITLTPQQAQAQGITLTFQQAQDLGISRTPKKPQVFGVTLTHEQAQALRPSVTLEQAQTLKVPITPKYTKAMQFPLTTEQAQRFGVPITQEQAKALGVTLMPEQTQAFSLLTPEQAQGLELSLTPEQVQPLGVPLTPGQIQSAGITLISEHDLKLRGSRTPGAPHIPKQPTTPFQGLKPSVPTRQSIISPSFRQFPASSAPITEEFPTFGISSPPLQISGPPLTQHLFAPGKPPEMGILPEPKKLLEPQTLPSSSQTLIYRGPSTPAQFLAPEVPPTLGQLPISGSPPTPGKQPLVSGIPSTSGQIPSLWAPLSPGQPLVSGISSIPKQLLESKPVTLSEWSQAFQLPATAEQSPYMQAPSTLGQHLAPWIFPGQAPLLWISGYPHPPLAPLTHGKPQKGLSSSVARRRLAIISSLKSKSALVHPNAPDFKVPQAPLTTKKVQMSEVSDTYEGTQAYQDAFAIEPLRTVQSYLTNYMTPVSRTPYMKPITSLPSLTTQLLKTSQISPSERDRRSRFPRTKKPKMMVPPSSPQGLEDKRYFVDVEAQRKNLILLNQAKKTSGLPSQLYTTARNLIIETLHMDTVRLGYLFRKYIAYRLIQSARNNIIKRLKATQNTGKGYETQNLYITLIRIDDYQKKVMRVWTEKQKSLEQKRNQCLREMIHLFGQLKEIYELNLKQPIPLIIEKKQIPASTKPVQQPLPDLLMIEDDTKSDMLKKFRQQEDQMEAMWNIDISVSSYPIEEKTSMHSLWAQLGGYPDIPRLLQLDIQSTFRKSLASIQSQFKNIPK
uniref:Family with sequence similarity 186 member A n=1 Tax=Microcebus murinus TaxID=30608 RepID=A0A8C5VBE5_MICMU